MYWWSVFGRCFVRIPAWRPFLPTEVFCNLFYHSTLHIRAYWQRPSSSRALLLFTWHVTTELGFRAALPFLLRSQWPAALPEALRRPMWHHCFFWALVKQCYLQYTYFLYYEPFFRSREPRLTTVGVRFADHATPSIRKSWHWLRQQAAVARSV
jgi:hypothetical protein